MPLPEPELEDHISETALPYATVSIPDNYPR